MRQSITTKFLSPTDHKGSRVKASCDAKSATYSWKHNLSAEQNHIEAARKLAESLDWEAAWFGGANFNTYVFVAANIFFADGIPPIIAEPDGVTFVTRFKAT